MTTTTTAATVAKGGNMLSFTDRHRVVMELLAKNCERWTPAPSTRVLRQRPSNAPPKKQARWVDWSDDDEEEEEEGSKKSPT